MQFKNIEKKVIEVLPVDNKHKDIFKRRLNKLKRDPKDFLRQSYNKQSKKFRQSLPIKRMGSNDFSVVTAVYNVEKYLDEYFQSLVGQSLSFKKHIQIICVDDGSTDSSAQIIKSWQKKYPKNIHYYYKENGGQGSARNLGLDYVETEWVTFIDPDDILDYDFFFFVDRTLSNFDNIYLISSYIRLVNADGKELSRQHPLSKYFDTDVTLIDVNDLERLICLSSASCFFRNSIIKKNKHKFDIRLRYSFEDAKFIIEYLSCIKLGKIVRLKTAVYFYRKHSQSTLSLSWLKKEKYMDTFKYGYLEVLDHYSNDHRMYNFIKRIVLYDINSFITYFRNNKRAINYLGDETEMFLYLFKRCIIKISDKNLIINAHINYLTKSFLLYILRNNGESFIFSVNRKNLEVFFLVTSTHLDSSLIQNYNYDKMDILGVMFHVYEIDKHTISINYDNLDIYRVLHVYKES